MVVVLPCWRSRRAEDRQRRIIHLDFPPNIWDERVEFTGHGLIRHVQIAFNRSGYGYRSYKVVGRVKFRSPASPLLAVKTLIRKIDTPVRRSADLLREAPEDGTSDIANSEPASNY